MRDQKLNQALKKLPEIQAPPTLIPKVMARIEAKAQQVWWQRIWWTWPVPAQALFMLVVAGAAIGVGQVGFNWFQGIFGVELVNSVAQTLEQPVQWVRPLAHATLLLVKAILRPLLIVGLLMYGTALGCGTALVKLGNSQRS